MWVHLGPKMAAQKQNFFIFVRKMYFLKLCQNFNCLSSKMLAKKPNNLKINIFHENLEITTALPPPH